jgi:hypothetical protein
VTGVVDEANRRAGLVSERSQELNDFGHVFLSVLFPCGCLHPGERVEHEETRPNPLTEVDQPGLPLRIVELHPCVRRDKELFPESLRRDRTTTAERIEASPERRLT